MSGSQGAGGGHSGGAGGSDASRLSPGLSEADLRHQDVMRAVVGRMQDTPYVLKGGTALLLAHDLPRHSTDLDFDSAKKLNVETRLRAGLADAGVEVKSLTLPKDTDTVQRFKIHYHDPDAPEAGTGFLKVETSFRDVSPDAEVVEAQGIRTYAISTIFEQKLDALANRDAPRDLFDLAHMAERYGDQLGPDQLARAEAATRDLDAIAGRFDSAFERDPVLRHLSTAEDETLRLREGVEREMGIRRERERTVSREREVDDGYGL